MKQAFQGFLLGIILALFATVVFGASGTKVVTTFSWDNPASYSTTPPTSMVITCGSQTGTVTDTTQFVGGQVGTAPISSVVKVDGTYTCTIAATNANGTGPASAPSPQFTRLNGVFTIAVIVPDAPGNMNVK